MFDKILTESSTMSALSFNDYRYFFFNYNRKVLIMNTPRIGGSLFLLIVGAILYFAIPDITDAVPLDTIGIILLIAGGVWFLIEMVFGAMKGKTTSTRTVQDSQGQAVQETQEVEQS